MTKIDDYRATLHTLTDWDEYLLQNSGLPGPRGNLELAHAVADEGDEALFRRYLAYGPDQAPTGTPEEFLAFCGLLGLGRLIAQGREEFLPVLRAHAADSRWRAREAVATGLQRLGQVDMERLIGEMEAWCRGDPEGDGGSWLEKRAAAAALAEPQLLRDPAQIHRVLQLLDEITASVAAAGVQERRSEPFRVLRQALGYCWSVAAAALPEEGKALMEKWFSSPDPDVRWIMRENLKKKRLSRMDESWVQYWIGRIG